MSYTSILENYNNLKSEYENKKNEIEKSILKHRKIIAKKEKQLRKHEMKFPYQVQYILEPLAVEIKEIINAASWEIYGPFGIENETTIRFNFENGDYKYIMFQNVYEKIFTGETTNEYPQGTIGYYNGLNNIYVDTPETIEEILKYMH